MKTNDSVANKDIKGYGYLTRQFKSQKVTRRSFLFVNGEHGRVSTTGRTRRVALNGNQITKKAWINCENVKLPCFPEAREEDDGARCKLGSPKNPK
jgi:hypothetical protein